MKINEPKLEQEEKQSRRIGWRMKVIGILVVALAILSGALYWYYTSTQAELAAAEQLQDFATQLEEEKARCNQVISQGQGEFSQYEYCTRLLNTFQ